MFWNNLVEICNKRNTTPTAVVKELKISGGSVTAWKEGSIPRSTTLKKLADYFNITVEELLKNEKNPVLSNGNDNFSLTPREKQIITAYREHPELQPAIDKMLNIDPPEDEIIRVYAAAKSEGNIIPDGYIYMKKSEFERLKNLPFTDDDLM